MKSSKSRFPTNPKAPTLHKWSMDFISNDLFEGKKFRVLTLADNYSRRSLAIQCEISLKGESVAKILKKVTSEQQDSAKLIKIDNGA